MVEELREAGFDLADVKVHSVSLMAGEQFSEAFTALNLNQKIPVLVDGGRSVIESCAILMYLAEKFPSDLLPLDDRRWNIIPWLFWQSANLGPVFGNKLSYTRYMDNIDDVQKAHPLERFGKEALRLVSVLDNKLGDNDFICGDTFTVADIAAYPWVRGYKWSKVNITRWPRVVDWVHRVRARPGVGRGLAYGVPKDEIDQWSKDRKADYARGGASIASNANLKTEI